MREDSHDSFERCAQTEEQVIINVSVRNEIRKKEENCDEGKTACLQLNANISIVCYFFSFVNKYQNTRSAVM